MKVVYNNEIAEESSVQLNFMDRGFQFGDGCFETFFYSKDYIPHFEEHYQRITDAFEVFGFSSQLLPSREDLQKQIKTLCSNNGFDAARVKMMFWRTEGALYAAPQTTYNSIITSKPLLTPERSKKSSILKTPINFFTPFSKYKTLSAVKYVYAGLHLNNSDAKDLVILSNENHVSEALYSNIFWIKDGVFYTPSLATGCIKGIVRDLVIDQLKKENIKVVEGLFATEDLLEADTAFTTNSIAIQSITAIDDTVLKEADKVEELHQLLIGNYI